MLMYGCWYEIFQREVLIHDEEFNQLRIIRHMDLPGQSACFPFNPYGKKKPLQKKDLEEAWIKVADITYPFSVAVYQDRLTTFSEQKDGEKQYRDISGDVAIGIESAMRKVFIQITVTPEHLKLCHTENEMDDCYITWAYQVSDRKEIKQMKEDKSEEYYDCRQMVSFDRVKECL